MKKKIGYILLIIILLGLGFWGFQWYKRWSSFNIEFPKQSDRVVRIDIERIGKKILKSESSNLTKGKLSGLIRESFDIPFNLLAFGAKSVSPNDFFTKLEIADVASFQTLLDSYFPKGKGNFRQNSTATIGLVFDNKNAVIIWGNDTSTQALLLATNYLNGKQTESFTSSKLAKISDFENDISSFGNMYNFKIDFENGAVRGSFISHIHQENTLDLKVPADAAVALVSRESFAILLKKMGVKKLSNELNIDDLEADIEPGFAVFLRNESSENRKEIVYFYNDDFEKVEKTVSNQVLVPQINLKLAISNPEKAFANLRQKQILLGQDSVNKSLFPLYSLHYFLKDSNRFFLYSGLNADTAYSESKTIEKDSDILAWIDFQKLEKFESLREFHPYIKIFERFSVQHLEGEKYSLDLTFKDKKKFSLVQLIRMFSH